MIFIQVLSLTNPTFSISVSLDLYLSLLKYSLCCVISQGTETTCSFSVGTSPALHPMDTQLGCLSRPRSCSSALFLQRGAAKLEMVYLPH